MERAFGDSPQLHAPPRFAAGGLQGPRRASRAKGALSLRGPRRHGVVAVLVAVASASLLGLTALTLDLGRVITTAQHTQQVADAAALAAAHESMVANPDAAKQRAGQIVTANATVSRLPITYDPNETIIYLPPQMVPGFRPLTGREQAVTVYTHEPVTFHFATVLNLHGTTVTRRATAARFFHLGAPTVPMWVGSGMTWEHGMTRDLYMTDDRGADPRVPGNFGWLEPKSGRLDFDLLLSGYNVPPETLAANAMEVGDVMDGLPGGRPGHWEPDLGFGEVGRLTRAQWEPWTYDTFTDYHMDPLNPRIIVVPIVTWVGRTGSNALWRIDDFAVFWIESINKRGSDKAVRATYIDPTVSGGSIIDYLGVWRCKLIV